MSITADHVLRWESNVDREFLATLATWGDSEASGDNDSGAFAASAMTTALTSPRVRELLSIVKSLTSTSSTQPLLPAFRIRELLHQSGLLAASARAQENGAAVDAYESHVEWVIVSKATVHTYGLLLDTLLEQIIPLSDDIWYWDDVLSSYTNSSLYTVQTFPLRTWAWGKDVWRDSRTRFTQLRHSPAATFERGTDSLNQQWRQFYGIVKRSIAERSVADLQRRLLSPVALSRVDARQKQKQLKHLRQLTATSLGILIEEGLRFDNREAGGSIKVDAEHIATSKGVVERSISLMQMVLQDAALFGYTVSEFEESVFSNVEADPELSTQADEETISRPAALAKRLDSILTLALPAYIREAQNAVAENGRPSPLVRYWLPTAIMLLSSSTLLRIALHRQDDIINWIRNVGSTTRDFWFNWVVEPIRKIIGTIRHDTNSEIAIMSRDSLKADRESLERMVVDFAIDKPTIAAGSSALTETQIADIRAKVREGDVTPVLRAYENDLRKPFIGAVKGDLIRSLLIQVQKTKVDLEVAISGIDALLKSQELVFGFVGLTPGLLVSIGAFQYLRGVVGVRKGGKRTARGRRSIRVLRNIDRIIHEASTDPSTQNGIMSYRSLGLLLSEVHVLRKLVHGLLPKEVERELMEDLEDVSTAKGLELQRKALDRIRWTYTRWLD